MSSSSDNQAEIARAFADAPLALKDGRTEEEKKSSNKFLLHNYDYYNLQKYLHAGVSLPLDQTSFEALFPKSNLKLLADIDASVYGNLESIFNKIASNCLAFENDTMPQFMTVTGGIINYCNDMDRYLSGKGLLLDQIKVVTGTSSISSSRQWLTHDIADGAVNTDASWKQACSKIKIILGILAKRAAARIDDINKLIAGLTTFKALTEVDYENVTYLKHQFISGDPVYNSMTDRSRASDQRTYSARLNKDLGDLQKQCDDLQKKIRQEEKERRNDIVIATTAVTYVWVVPVGTIAAATVMAYYSVQAVEMKGKIEANTALLIDDRAQVNTVRTCLTTVQGIIGDIRNVAESIEAAIAALSDLKGSFTQQSIDFNNLADQWGYMNDSANSATMADEMAINMEPSVESAVISWAEIKQLALDFQTNSAIQYVPPPPPAKKS